MGECVVRTSESDSPGRNQRELHALSERHQSAIDQFFGRVAMRGELQVQPVRIQLHQAARESQRLDRLSRIARMLDGRGQDAPTARHASQGNDYVGYKTGNFKGIGEEQNWWACCGKDTQWSMGTIAHGNGCKFRRISGWRAIRSRGCRRPSDEPGR